ncbi:uncharacterized protein KQ657_003790 [Scheffersomyces spartinae]|uniref:Uncharacterized protein n=1 Tax=Scheffersomyces spartinae TaxID=45513 RepID=A0A9P7VDE2_9ASCO|nr:uncharacterized protein KQ657_003790 [Scheffersomyces spartinae]KAG7195264.1 hypothetical protein KQ657_003790 [Scheffersomyces spartinae]
MNSNSLVLKDLLDQLESIPSRTGTPPLERPLLLDRQLSPLINYLTPFQKLQDTHRFSRVQWLGEDQGIHDEAIVIVDGSNLHKHRYGRHRTVYLIVANLDRSDLYRLKMAYDGDEDDTGGEDDNNININISVSDNDSSRVERIIQSQVFDNVTYPVLVDHIQVYLWLIPMIYKHNVYMTNLLNSNIVETFFENPLKVVSETCKCVQLLGLKFANMYGKGDWSDVFINMYKNEMVPDFIARQQPEARRVYLGDNEMDSEEFILLKEHELVVFDRDIDLFPLVLVQLTYRGLVDVGISGEDELYNEIKDLNFATVGHQLNKLAKETQGRYQLVNRTIQESDGGSDLKALVIELNQLTKKQEMVKRHTERSEDLVGLFNEPHLEYQTQMVWDSIDTKDQVKFMPRGVGVKDSQEMLSNVLLMYLKNGGHVKEDVLMQIHLQYGLSKVVEMEKWLRWFKPKWDFTTVSKYWNLIGESEEMDTTTTNNIVTLDNTKAPTSESEALLEIYKSPNYAIAGNYVPLTYRLVEALYYRESLRHPIGKADRRPSWNQLSIEMIGGKTREEALTTTNNKTMVSASGKHGYSYLVVVLLGGVTFAEISLFKYLEGKLAQRGVRKRIILVSNGVVRHL